MKLTKTISIPLVAIAALGLGAFLGIQYEARKSRSVEAERGDATRSEPTMAVLQAENRKLNDEIAHLRARQLGQANPSQVTKPANVLTPLDRLRVLTDFQQRKLATGTLTFVEQNGRLTQGFAELFDLAAPEQEALQRAIETARERLTVLERENATVTRTKNGDVVIEIDSFAKEGGAVYDELMQAFAQTLGKERNVAYLVLGAEQVERALGRFGAVDFRATISRNKQAGTDYYTIKTEHKLPGENGSTTSVLRSVKEIEESFGTLAKLLPADFGRDK